MMVLKLSLPVIGIDEVLKFVARNYVESKCPCIFAPSLEHVEKIKMFLTFYNNSSSPLQSFNMILIY